MSNNEASTSKLSKKDKKAFELANKAFELIVEHQTPPFPSTYALWYAYAAGSNLDVNKKIDTALKKDGTLSVYDINHIHNTYLLSQDIDNDKNDEIAQKFEHEMNEMMDLIQKSMMNNDAYSDSLDAAQEMLPGAAASPEKIKEIVSELIKQNSDMKTMTSELNDGLKNSQNQIMELNNQLTEAREESMRDGLTKVANRRAFDERLEQEIIAAETLGHPLCLVLADIDHFKNVNDTYGHQVGDGILQTFANLMRKNVKGGDMVARYGGEEFALILPDTRIEDAFNVVEAVRKNLEASRLVIKSTGQSVGQVTSSFGICALHQGMTMEQLISRTDAKLYEAKKNGRNRIEMENASAAAA